MIDLDTAVPAAVKDGNLSVCGQTGPETPQIRVHTLIFIRTLYSEYGKTAGIQRLDQAGDESPFAGSAKSFK